MQYKNISNSISLVDVVVNKTCVIYLDDSTENHKPWKKLPCNHFFHAECIDKNITQFHRDMCPTCKTVIKLQPSIEFDDETCIV